jgi:hypothetical protein
MSKREETKASADETVTAENDTVENKEPEMVTVPREEFEALKAQMALMAQKMAAEDRQKSKAELSAEAAAAEAEAVKTANAEAEELVDYYVDTGSLRSNQNVEVAINGVQYVIPRGKAVKIPRKVVNVIENAKKQKAAAYKLQKERKAEAEEASNKGFI